VSIPATTASRLKNQLDCLPILIQGLKDGALENRPIPGKWSARENLAHLARYHQIFLERVERILAENRPALPRYAQEEDAGWPPWTTLPAGEVLSRLAALRAQLVKRVEGLSSSELARTGVHSRFGEMTLVEWLEFFLLHEGHHLMLVLQRSRQFTP
jgi:uncharacterized damage-inducible protein DinB